MTLITGSYDGIDRIFSYRRDFSTGWLHDSKDQNQNLYYAMTAANPDGRQRIAAQLGCNTSAPVGSPWCNSRSSPAGGSSGSGW